MSSCTRSHSAAGCSGRSERHDRRFLELHPRQLPGGVEGRNDLDRDAVGGRRRLEEEGPHSFFTAGHHDGPIRRVAVDDRRLVTAHHPLRALAPSSGPHRAERLAVTLLPERDRATTSAGRQVGEQLRRAEGPGRERRSDGRREERARKRDATHLLGHDAHLEQAGTVAGATELVGDEQAGPSKLDEGGPQLWCEPALIVGQAAQQLRVACTLERGARHVLECELPLVVREVHGLRPLPYPFIDVDESTAPPAPAGRAMRRAVMRGPLIPDTGVRVHGGRVPFPRWTSP